MRWTPEREAVLRHLWGELGGSFGKIASVMGTSRGTIDGKSRQMGLQHPAHGDGISISRESAASINARTMFPSRVSDPVGMVLKPGNYQRKIGPRVTKGAWKGFPIYCLTLEERATCPRSCNHWLSCYGNNMGQATRFKHGPALEQKVWSELRQLQEKNPRGFVVRLHILGDFYSPAYVDFWGLALDVFPALRIFGYTHRQPHTQIGQRLAAVRQSHPERFAIRTSDAAEGFRTITIENKSDAAPAILCPAQVAGTTSRTCGTCALCWSTEKPIAFLKH